MAVINDVLLTGWDLQEKVSKLLKSLLNDGTYISSCDSTERGHPH